MYRSARAARVRDDEVNHEGQSHCQDGCLSDCGRCPVRKDVGRVGNRALRRRRQCAHWTHHDRRDRSLSLCHPGRHHAADFRHLPDCTRAKGQHRQRDVDRREERSTLHLGAHRATREAALRRRGQRCAATVAKRARQRPSDAIA